MLTLVSDENFKGEILRGLRRRLPELDAVRVQDVDLSESSDASILEWSAAQGRIVLTHDRATMPHFAYERVRAGQPMTGVFLVSDVMPTGQAIDELLLAIQCLTPEECRGRVIFFPM